MMSFRTLAGAGLSALLLTGTVGLVTHGVAPAVATGRVDARAEKQAAGEAAKARRALARRQWDKAVALAEAAVEHNGNDAGHRQLLGSAYLRAGRFQSAAQALGDVLVLQPDNAGAALNLALARIALGQWAEARELLDVHAAAMPAADRGLALALAGDPMRAVEVLTDAARTPVADAKTRQNLALAMALAGRWQEARVLIGVDMTPVEADQRIMQWVAFARPAGAADQVASLLGVTPAADPGQPLAIALAGAASPAQQQAAVVDAYMPGRAPAEVEAAAAVTAEAPAAEVAKAPDALPLVERFLATQAAPATAAAPMTGVKLLTARAPYKRALAPRKAAVAAKGSWSVQIGAYRNAAVSQQGWARATRRLPAMAGYAPAEMTATVNGARFRRLSVSGFSRAAAVTLCQRYRAQGGACFVRPGAGEQVAAWHKPARVQFAAR